jgi:hypothetical protein
MTIEVFERIHMASPEPARLPITGHKTGAISLLASVALLQDLTERGLLRGQVGTVVESLAPDVYEVEFSDAEGRTYATLALRSDQLIVLHHEPVSESPAFSHKT